MKKVKNNPNRVSIHLFNTIWNEGKVFNIFFLSVISNRKKGFIQKQIKRKVISSFNLINFFFWEDYNDFDGINTVKIDLRKSRFQCAAKQCMK